MLFLMAKTPDEYRGEGVRRYFQRYGRPTWRPGEEEDFEAWVEDSILASIRKIFPCLNKPVVRASGFGLVRWDNAGVVTLVWQFEKENTVWATVNRSREGGYSLFWSGEFGIRSTVDPHDGGNEEER